MGPIISEKLMFLKNKNNQRIKLLFSKIPDTGWLVFLLFAGSALFASIHSLLLEHFYNPTSFPDHMHYGNYIIFKKAWEHLITARDLYAAFPGELPDLFKYSPTFAMFFGIFSIFPDAIGLPLWNLLNALVLYFSVKALPNINDRKKNMILLFITIELLTSLQNSQSNALMAGLLIFTFVMLERRQYFIATLFLTLTIFIKLFGGVAFALFLFYPEKWKLVRYSLFWVILLLLLPLPLTGFSHLQFLYQSWRELLLTDFSGPPGYSVMGWLSSWFGINLPKSAIVAAGLLAGGIPFLFRKFYSIYNFRLLMFTALLIWTVIFNHKAESPTFIIAMSGIAIWLFARKITVVNAILAAFAFLLTSLSTTELFMPIRDMVVEPYVLKVVPCIFIWGKILFDLTTFSATDIE